MKTIIIKVGNTGVYLNKELFIPIQQTSIPIEYLKFKTNTDIYWKVEQLIYTEKTKSLNVKVVDYAVKDVSDFYNQKPKKEVSRIEYEKFDWQKIEPLLYSYTKSRLKEVIYDSRVEKDKARGKISQQTNQKLYLGNKSKSNIEIGIKKQPIIEPLKFSFPFNDAQFNLGYVSFSKFIKKIGVKVDFKIKNDYILPEFHQVRMWFSKILKTRKFEVTGYISITDGSITEVIATSPQIEAIDDSLIDSVKYQRTISLIKPLTIQVNKSLFTADEIFDEMKDDVIQGNVFKQTEQDILKVLLENSTIRNRQHLEYLSGAKQSINHKLRFTLSPLFGFLFLVEGEQNNHFVWELLNSHATYIWSIGKLESDIELQYKRIEDTINTIRNIGREEYKRAYKQNHIDDDLIFFDLKHNDITSDFVDGFVRWKHYLNERLT